MTKGGNLSLWAGSSTEVGVSDRKNASMIKGRTG